MRHARPRLGATPEADGRGTRFAVWAPHADRVDAVLLDPDEVVVLAPAGDGFLAGVAAGAGPGRRYRYRLDGGDELPDPASSFQPEGVAGPSEVVAPWDGWTDAGWRGVPLAELVLYELHVGTFTPEGTFDAIVPRLAELRELGVTAIELMPVAQFPGARNWGYDGVFPYAVQDSYGGPAGLSRLVDAAHAEGLAVCLDCVFNHLGPEGNVLTRFGPVFTERYRTPWGAAINMDGPGSDGVRGFLIGSALRFMEEFHVDALRLDAVDQIADASATHFLAELADAVAEASERAGRPLHLIAESDLNDPRMITSRAAGGLGMDAQWSDDLHHSLHALVTGEGSGYYADFAGRGTRMVARAYREGFAYTGQRSRHRGRRHGAPAAGIHGSRFVVFGQNHDQVGNRMLGDRLAHTAGFEAAKLMAGAVLLAPQVPLLFMGEEHADDAPFPFFTSHSGAELIEAVRRGRAEEFRSFRWAGEPPDPQAEETFRSAVLHWDTRREGGHGQMLDLYRELLRRRRELPPLRDLAPDRVEIARTDDPAVVWLLRGDPASETVLVCLHFGPEPRLLDVPFTGERTTLIDSADARFGGPGAVAPSGGAVTAQPQSFLVLGDARG
ncbi:MAG TPA: malto-oligosyltrehalose trehalohydrolase [Gaiellales bacterium]|nr:malto-oligosyltrehalose trehalohydrolase [Gaiellales bacterium]